MRTLRNFRLVRVITLLATLSLIWLQIGPALAGTAIQSRHDRQTARLRLEAGRRASKLAPGLTQTPDATLRKKIAAKEKAAQEAAAARSAADVRLLSPAEMTRASGRGPLRNPYFAGEPMPWHRSFHDVNINTGNLSKSFTDIQVAPARGAGLVLQRTYSSDETRVGPFGLGWTHAYDIRIQEAADVQAQAGSAIAVPPGSPNDSGDATINEVPRTDFFGAKHTYHRDADGLYSPPAYLYDEMSSDYNASLVNGPTKVEADTEKGMDGTIKHYVNVVTLADGSSGNERACDYIQDRYGNKTVLTYGQSYVQSDGSTRKMLTQVMDPTGRTLTFQWTNFGTTTQPAYRITEADAPTDSATGTPSYRVTYDYYTDSGSANAANELYNLKTVHLDPDGLNRTTTYTYTSCSPVDLNTKIAGTTVVGAPEYGLLASVTDPLGHMVSYTYSYVVGPTFWHQLNHLYVSQIVEPGSGGLHTWTIAFQLGASDWFVMDDGFFGQTSATSPDNMNFSFALGMDNAYRTEVIQPSGANYESSNGFFTVYDSDNNVLYHDDAFYTDDDSGPGAGQFLHKQDSYSYGPHGNVLTHQVTSADYSAYNAIDSFPGVDTTTYYDASRYFQKKSTTDMDGHTTIMGVGTDTAGNAGDPDPNIGDRGQILWVQDSGYNDAGSASYQKQYTYTYNSYGQKTSETNLKGVVTRYYYGGDSSSFSQLGTHPNDLGNLCAVVQDSATDAIGNAVPLCQGQAHLARTTTMHYDVMGRVSQSVDPKGQESSFNYNSLGQPLTVQVYSDTGHALQETISYTYDGNGRTQSVTQAPISGAALTDTIAYEPGNDFVSSVTDSLTGTISYTYYLSGTRKTMTLPGGGTWTYRYDGNSVDLSEDDPNKMAMYLSTITDDQGRTVDYSRSDYDYPIEPGGFNNHAVYNHHLRRVKSNETFDSYGNLASYLLTTYHFDNDTHTVFRQPLRNMTHGWVSEVQTTWYWTDVNGAKHSRLVADHSYGYDTAGLRTGHTVTTAVPNADGSPQYTGGTPQYDNPYGYGSVINQITTTRTENYGYDALNRLKSVDYGDGQTQGYTFDAMGNRVQKTDSAAGTTSYAVDAANRLLTAGANTYTSDANGNTLSDGTRTNAWDSQNRLVSCTKDGVTSAYTYGSDGLRRTSTVNGVTTYYVYDGQTLIREMKQNAQGVLQSTATYLCGPRGPEYRRDDTQAEGTYTDSTGTHPAGKTRWYVYDGLGSVVGEVDPSGNLTSSGTFDVYGAKRQGGTGTATSRQGFVGSLGHVTDSETGLVYMRARYYDPNVGRFVSQDPAGNGSNWYVYCGDDPVNKVDADGKTFDSKSQAGLGDVVFSMILTAAAFGAAMEKDYKAAMTVAGVAAVSWGCTFLFGIRPVGAGEIATFTGGALGAGFALAVTELIGLIIGNASLASACPGGFAAVAIAGVTVEGCAIVMACFAVEAT